MRKLVGISQKIKRAWLDAVLDRLVTTTDEAELRTYLDKHLKEELPGTESRAKTAGIILRIWSGIRPERAPLRDRAVALLPRISGQERIWLHWGMTALAYPFFRDTAEVVGRLLALQDDFTTAHVQGRLLTTWGDRVTSKEAAQKLINTLVDWEVLRSTKTKGHFLLARKMTASIPDLQLWLLEALLGASNADEIEAQQLLRLPESFPFTLNVGIADLRRHEGFNIHRQGLDMDMVALRKVKLEPPPKPTKTPKQEETAQTPPPTLFEMGVVPTHGKPAAVAPKPMPPVGKQRTVQQTIKDEVLRRLADRAAEVPHVQEATAVPVAPFAAPVAECVEQFRGGRFFGCIALSHSVMEAMIFHVWKIKLKKKAHQDGGIEKNLDALRKLKAISAEWKVTFDQMRAERHSFHYLRPAVESERRKLEEVARSTMKLLNDLEREFFGSTLRNGVVVPDHPEYWSIK